MSRGCERSDSEPVPVDEFHIPQSPRLSGGSDSGLATCSQQSRRTIPAAFAESPLPAGSGISHLSGGVRHLRMATIRLRP